MRTAAPPPLRLQTSSLHPLRLRFSLPAPTSRIHSPLSHGQPPPLRLPLQLLPLPPISRPPFPPFAMTSRRSGCIRPRLRPRLCHVISHPLPQSRYSRPLRWRSRAHGPNYCDSVIHSLTPSLCVVLFIHCRFILSLFYLYQINEPPFLPLSTLHLVHASPSLRRM
jgi:hypothetical protein